MKKWGLIISLFGLLLFSSILIRKSISNESETNNFFVSVPTEFNSSNIPCVILEIEEKKLSAILDLGYEGCVSAKSDFLNKIKDKTFVKSEKFYTWTGKCYEEKLYKIPKLNINNMLFTQLDLNEENPFSCADFSIIKDSAVSEGKLGWSLFKNSILFLDLGNSKVIICNSIESLQSRGYKISAFTKVPLSLKKGIIEIEAHINNRHLMCFLDTGCTWNLLNSQKTTIANVREISEMTSFQIEGIEFGPIAFHSLPMQFPMPIEAVLGMEFFREHQVFLDLINGYAYIAKRPKS